MCKDGFGSYTKIIEKLNIEIDKGLLHVDISSLIKDARLCLFNYGSMGVLENFCNKFTNNFYEKIFMNSFPTSFEKKYTTLMNNNIMFNDPKKLVIHLEKNGLK